MGVFVLLFLIKFIDSTSASIVFVSIFTIKIIRYFYKAERPPILGIYRLPHRGYWLKVLFMFVVLSAQKYSRKLKKVFGFKSTNVLQYEKPQKLSFHRKAIDAVYFNGVNYKGDVLILGLARRKNGLINGFILLKNEQSGLGILELPKQPDTNLYQETELEEYAAENLKVEPIIPMKMWKISYKGLMKRASNSSETFDVEIDGIWRSELPFFNFDTDVDPFLMAKCLALEKWNQNYFKVLKEVHQTHYEQFGEMDCTIKIDGKPYFSRFNTLRDHTFGNHRNWRYFNRYAMHIINLKNGDRIMVTSICSPIVFSVLNVGYIYIKSKDEIFPIQSTDFLLYQHGENGKPPVDYAFSFTADNKKFLVKVNGKSQPTFFLEEQREAKIVEMISKFEVNGVVGWGAAEYQYYN